jgi:2-hydroxymuconate-semialdehyde hydrolase
MRKKMMPIDTPVAGFYLRVANAKIFVRVKGAGQAVLLLHGGGPGTSGDGWLEFMNVCAPDRQFIAPDFLGFGYSDAPEADYGTEKFVNDTIELMQTLCLESVVLVGHSMGAAIAAAVAVRCPELVSHLILIAPGGGSYGLDYRSPGIEQIARISQEPTEANIRILVELMSHRPELHDGEVDKRMALIRRPGILAAQRYLQQSRQNARLGGRGAGVTLAQKIRSLSRPIALLWGQYEEFNPVGLGPQIKAALPPQARYYLIADAGHNVHYDLPHAVARVFTEILGPTFSIKSRS